MEKKNNIAMIGMAGVGKSTTGKRLAECLNYAYVECDALMTEEASRRGVNKFLLSDPEFVALEGDVISRLAKATQTVIDTGGSAIYSTGAMAILKTIATTIYLKDNIDYIQQRFIARGQPHVVGIGEGTFAELFLKRNALYEGYADITIDISAHAGLEDTVQKVIAQLT